MAVLGTAAARTDFGTIVVCDNDAGALKVTVYDARGGGVLVAAYTLVASGVVGNPAMQALPNGSIVLLYITGTATRNWRVSQNPRPSAGEWIIP